MEAGQRRVFVTGGQHVLRLHPDHQTRVGEGGVATREAHAVEHDLSRFGGRGYDPPAGAHAKREHAFPAETAGQLVGRGGQTGMAGARPVLHLVDPWLRVFDAHADREGLGFERHVFLEQHAVDVAGGVPGGQYDSRGFDGAAVGDAHSSDAALARNGGGDQPADPLLEQELHTGLL